VFWVFVVLIAGAIGEKVSAYVFELCMADREGGPVRVIGELFYLRVLPLPATGAMLFYISWKWHRGWTQNVLIFVMTFCLSIFVIETLCYIVRQKKFVQCRIIWIV